MSKDLSNDARIVYGRDEAQARGRGDAGDESRLRLGCARCYVFAAMCASARKGRELPEELRGITDINEAAGTLEVAG